MRPHPQIMAVDMRARRNRLQRLSDDLAIAHHKVTRCHVAQCDFVTPRRGGLSCHAKPVKDGVCGNILQRNRHCVVGVQL